MQPFELAEALALSSADGDPSSAKPPRDDDAPFVAPEIEVLGVESVPASDPASAPEASSPSSGTLTTAIVPRRRRQSHAGLIALALLVGVVAMAYAYFVANR